MKQKIRFDLGLYIEGLRQLRVTGIIGLIVMAGLSIIMLTSLEPSYGIYNEPICTTYTGIGILPWLLLSFVLFTPLLMFMMFHFMNKRNASDLYHSLPHTRGTVYLSFSAAAISWVLMIILASVLTMVIGSWIRSDFIDLAYDTLFLWMLYCISASILVGGAIMIAKGISGTLLNNIILTGLILFLPRFFLTILIDAIEANPIFDNCIGNDFTSSTINPVTGMVFYLFGINPTMNIHELAVSIPAIVYGFILGLIYFVAGAFLFCRRNSETASQSAPSRRLQAVYRILIATAMCSIVVMILFQWNYLYLSDEKSWSSVIIPYIIIIFLYFLYELLTTRRLKNLVKAIPGLGIVAVLNVVMYFGLAGIYNSAMSFRPAADEINSITVLPETDDSYYLSYEEYVLHAMDGVKLTDQDVLENVAYSLNQSLVRSENDVNALYQNNSQYTSMVPMLIETDGGSVKRNVYLAGTALNDVILSNQKYQETWMNPPVSDGSVYVYFGPVEDAKALYDQFRKEVKDADFQTWYDASCSMDAVDFSFEISYLSDGVTYAVEIPVYGEVAPETVSCYYEQYNQAIQEMLEETTEKLSEIKKADADIEGMVYVNVDDEDGMYFEQEWELSGKSVELPLRVLESRGDGPVQSGELTVNIDISIWHINDPELEPFGYSFSFPADETTLDLLEDLDEEFSGLYQETAARIY